MIKISSVRNDPISYRVNKSPVRNDPISHRVNNSPVRNDPISYRVNKSPVRNDPISHRTNTGKHPFSSDGRRYSTNWENALCASVAGHIPPPLKIRLLPFLFLPSPFHFRTWFYFLLYLLLLDKDMTQFYKTWRRLLMLFLVLLWLFLNTLILISTYPLMLVCLI